MSKKYHKVRKFFLQERRQFECDSLTNRTKTKVVLERRDAKLHLISSLGDLELESKDGQYDNQRDIDKVRFTNEFDLVTVSLMHTNDELFQVEFPAIFVYIYQLFLILYFVYFF